jgi:hypothetical protein
MKRDHRVRQPRPKSRTASTSGKSLNHQAPVQVKRRPSAAALKPLRPRTASHARLLRKTKRLQAAVAEATEILAKSRRALARAKQQTREAQRVSRRLGAVRRPPAKPAHPKKPRHPRRAARFTRRARAAPRPGTVRHARWRKTRLKRKVARARAAAARAKSFKARARARRRVRDARREMREIESRGEFRRKLNRDDRRKFNDLTIEQQKRLLEVARTYPDRVPPELPDPFVGPKRDILWGQYYSTRGGIRMKSPVRVKSLRRKSLEAALRRRGR